MLLYLTITDRQRDELKNHLEMNGYSVDWETDDVINVDDEELSYINTILLDRYIPFTDDINEQWFGDRKVKSKIDIFYNLAREISDTIEDYGKYTDEEVEMLEEVANVITVYENIFK